MPATLSQSIRPQVRTIDGLSIRDAESAPREDQALLLSPWPEGIYCYEPTWTRPAAYLMSRQRRTGRSQARTSDIDGGQQFVEG